MNKNKQELIQKWENKTGAPAYEISDFPINPSKNEMYIAGYGVARTEIIEDLKQLDEPQKPVVPKFFDDWAKRVIAERDKFYAISLIARAGWGYGVDYELGESENPSTTRELLDWLVEDSLYLNKEKAINALLYGYEVEKEPLYRVKLGEGYFVEYQGRGALITPDENEEIKIFDSKSDAERTAQVIGGTMEEVVEG